MEIANLFDVECELSMEHERFRIRETGIGDRLGAEREGRAPLPDAVRRTGRVLGRRVVAG